MRALYRRRGLDFASSEVIHGGVRVDQFHRPLETRPPAGDRLRILYVGQLTQDRGLHTLIEALDRLDPAVRSRVELTVVGEGQAAYERQVKQQAAALRMGDGVTFLGKIQHDEMPQVYARHDLLVFPSMRDEGLPLTLVEAMLAGCAVVTTGSGGAMEVARAADLPLFPQGDAGALGGLLTVLSAHPQKMRELAARGQEIAAREFSFDRMLERWLATLERLRGLRTAHL
jgi:glycosyltransferase involved in cell wall biosynthesis